MAGKHNEGPLRPHTPQAQSLSWRNVQVIIRFATDLPDLPVTLDYGPYTTVSAIKRQARSHLPDEYRGYGMRLIFGGKVLPDRDSVLKSMRVSVSFESGPENARATGDGDGSLPFIGKGKGKAKASLRLNGIGPDGGSEEERSLLSPPEPRQPARKYYVHCSLSAGPLSPSSLEAELEFPLATEEASAETATSTQPERSTEAQVVGFDRLLTSPNGFTREDINALRAQFRANITSRHTPESMPSPQEMLEMEERWLDAGPGSANDTGVSGAAGAGGGFDDDDDTGAALNDAFGGAILGFLWPLGAVCWGLREEGVWSSRRQIAVMGGILFHVAFGFLRLVD